MKAAYIITANRSLYMTNRRSCSSSAYFSVVLIFNSSICISLTPFLLILAPSPGFFPFSYLNLHFTQQISHLLYNNIHSSSMNVKGNS